MCPASVLGSLVLKDLWWGAGVWGHKVPGVFPHPRFSSAGVGLNSWMEPGGDAGSSRLLLSRFPFR